ncbi:hypothetical protein CF70_017835 [Cupriavidus sp. SK-3]|uniref:H-NS family nucleoid-associated regulatory protein n=1 Tax=Cupriavidus sp. SK-3 TaxID=1470558 RepID=UPI000453A6ED|nr:ParB N-terminal domain-containing protein [Cupriavidus sp. SK-3]KDP84680.1 hypothetical protein CF70_017835 [Cupriavidus sp. SK-3]
MTATTTAGTHSLISLSRLFLSSDNARKTPPKRAAIEALAASIAAHGLLQNLVVMPELKNGEETGRYEVIAGQRRWLAMQHLVSSEKMDAHYSVDCTVRHADIATEASVAENTMREPMHPADEFEAFKAMIDQGAKIEDIAANFGVTPLVVQRRLKLANVSPKMIQIYRDGDASLDQLMALAITDDHDAQERTWNESDNWDRQATRLRAKLAKGAVEVRSNKLARFVGMDAYEAAGGHVERDLFSDNGDGFMADAELLERLASDKLDAELERVRAEGWSWAEVRADFFETWKFDEAICTTRKPTTKERSRIESLKADLEKHQIALDKLEDADDYGTEHDTHQERIEEIEEQLATINLALNDWATEAKATAGAIIAVTSAGELKVHRGLIARGRGSVTGAGDASSGRTIPGDKPKKPALSESLAKRLTAHRTAALQLQMVEQPHIALAVLAHALVGRLFRKAQSLTTNKTALHFSIENGMDPLPNYADDIETSPAWTKLQAIRKEILATLPKSDKDQLQQLIAMPQQDLLQLLALCTAAGVNAVTGIEGPNAADAIAEAVELDMAQWWTATPASFLNHLPKARAIEAVAEATSKKDAEALATMKKDKLAQAAEQKLAGTGWLPKILRGPKKATPKKAAPEKKKTAAKPAAPAKTAAPADLAKPTLKKLSHPAVRYRDSAGNTWTGRGKRPGWLAQALADGKTLDAFLTR